MPITHDIDGSILVIHQNGVTDPTDIMTAIQTAFSDPALPAEACLLWDAVDAPAQASPEKMQALLRRVGSDSFPLTPRFAMVVATELQFGVSRMFAVYAEDAGVDARVFYNMDDAKTWLRT